MRGSSRLRALQRELFRKRAQRREEQERAERLALVDRRWEEGGDPLRQVEEAAEEIMDALEDHDNGRITDKELDEIVTRCSAVHEKWLAGELPARDEEVMHDGS